MTFLIVEEDGSLETWEVISEEYAKACDDGYISIVDMDNKKERCRGGKWVGLYKADECL